MGASRYFSSEGKILPEVLAKFHNSALVKKLSVRTLKDLKPVYDNKDVWVEGNDRPVNGKNFIKVRSIRMCFYKPSEIGVKGFLDKDMDLLDKILNAANKMKPPCKYCAGNCPNDEDHCCDGYSGDIDGLYKKGK